MNRKSKVFRRFVLRFDDICPTMHWKTWLAIEDLLIKHELKPILAIVPDNRDPVLQVDPPAKDFWQRARYWQSLGWTIALHGYQHLYVAKAAGIVNLRKKSEFASLSESAQEEKLRQGTEIFAREGIHSRVWIAPGDAFDEVTVSLLPRFGLDIISAGWFWEPFSGPHGVTWMPCQLSILRNVPSGVWTVCYHPNSWSDLDFEQFQESLEQYKGEITSLDQAMTERPPRHARWCYRFCTSPRLSSLLLRAQLKLWKMWNEKKLNYASLSVCAGLLE